MKNTILKNLLYISTVLFFNFPFGLSFANKKKDFQNKKTVIFKPDVRSNSHPVHSIQGHNPQNTKILKLNLKKKLFIPKTRNKQTARQVRKQTNKDQKLPDPAFKTLLPLPLDKKQMILNELLLNEMSQLKKRILFQPQRGLYPMGFPLHMELFDQYDMPEEIINLLGAHVTLINTLVLNLNSEKKTKRELIKKQAFKSRLLSEDTLSFYVNDSIDASFLDSAFFTHSYYLSLIATKKPLPEALVYKLLIPLLKFSKLHKLYHYDKTYIPLLKIFQSSRIRYAWFETITENEKEKREKIEKNKSLIENYNNNLKDLKHIEKTIMPFKEKQKYKKTYLTKLAVFETEFKKQNLDPKDFSVHATAQKYQIILDLSKEMMLPEAFLQEMGKQNPIPELNLLQRELFQHLSKNAKNNKWSKQSLKVINQIRCRLALATSY